MKIACCISLTMLSVILATALIAAENDRPAAIKHTFRICVVEDKVNFMKHNEVNLDELKLHEQPLITENDIVEYDWETHTIKMTEKGFEPFAKPAAWDFPVGYNDETRTLKAKGDNHQGESALLGEAFVVIADGERCYLGVFTGSFSSVALSLPVINLFPLPEKAPPENSVRIERAYASDTFAKVEDPRCDARVKTALEALGKLCRGR